MVDGWLEGWTVGSIPFLSHLTTELFKLYNPVSTPTTHERIPPTAITTFAQYCVVLYCIALHCIVLYCVVLYCIYTCIWRFLQCTSIRSAETQREESCLVENGVSVKTN